MSQISLPDTWTNMGREIRWACGTAHVRVETIKYNMTVNLPGTVTLSGRKALKDNELVL